MKREGKRGALELSITTIVIVVLAITILTLGLVFTKGIFGKLTSLSDDVFGKADTIIEGLEVDSKFSCPTNVNVEQGRTTTFKCTVGHDGTLSGTQTFTMTQLNDGNVQGGFANKVKARIISPLSVSLYEGEQATFVVQVSSTTDAPLSAGTNPPSYQINVNAGTSTYVTSAFIITVKKGTGLF